MQNFFVNNDCLLVANNCLSIYLSAPELCPAARIASASKQAGWQLSQPGDSDARKALPHLLCSHSGQEVHAHFSSRLSCLHLKANPHLIVCLVAICKSQALTSFSSLSEELLSMSHTVTFLPPIKSRDLGHAATVTVNPALRTRGRGRGLT